MTEKEGKRTSKLRWADYGRGWADSIAGRCLPDCLIKCCLKRGWTFEGGSAWNQAAKLVSDR